MEDAIISDVVYEKIKKFDHRSLEKRQRMLIDKLITNEELKKRYKSYGLCEECKQPNTSYNGLNYWCQPCYSNHFRQDFENWTSGNCNIDEFIQQAQLKAKCHDEVIEWIGYDQFEDPQYLAKGGFGITYKANWKNGRIINRDVKNNQWNRSDDIFVALKCLHNSQDIAAEFLKEIGSHIKVNNSKRIIPFYGITKDPKTFNFAMVLKYADDGNLRQNLNSYHNKCWKAKLENLLDIAQGLNDIHEKNLIHRDFHSGNILNTNKINYITDLGLCQPANQQNDKKEVFGVLPYVAPEVLRGNDYTEESDIYGFGIIAYEFVTGLPPYHDVAHDELLAIRICEGLRPRSNYKVPQQILELIQRCWDADPAKRPNAKELKNILKDLNDMYFDRDSMIRAQTLEAFEFNKKSSSCGDIAHPQAVYTSRLLDFKNLSKEKNAEAEYSDSIVIDFANIK